MWKAGVVSRRAFDFNDIELGGGRWEQKGRGGLWQEGGRVPFMWGKRRRSPGGWGDARSQGRANQVNHASLASP